MANGDELNQMSDREPSNPLRTNSDTNIVMIILMMKITTAEDLIGIEWIWNGLEKTGIEMLYFFSIQGSLQVLGDFPVQEMVLKQLSSRISLFFFGYFPYHLIAYFIIANTGVLFMTFGLILIMVSYV